MTSPLVSMSGKTIFSLLALLVLLVDPVAVADRPNVVLISVDDLNDWCGCLGGHLQASTPNLDRLQTEACFLRQCPLPGDDV